MGGFYSIIKCLLYVIDQDDDEAVSDSDSDRPVRSRRSRRRPLEEDDDPDLEDSEDEDMPDLLQHMMRIQRRSVYRVYNTPQFPIELNGKW